MSHQQKRDNCYTVLVLLIGIVAVGISIYAQNYSDNWCPEERRFRGWQGGRYVDICLPPEPLKAK